MFEVIVTYRPDFREAVLDRYPTWEEAIEKAREIVFHHPDQVVRAWVRAVSDAKVKSDWGPA